MQTIKINITPKSIFLLFGIGLLLFVCYQSRDILLLLFGSYVIASSLWPPINFLRRFMPRNLAIVVVYVLLIVLIITLLFPLFGIITKQSGEFINQLPSYWVEFKKLFYQWHINYSHVDLLPDIDNITSLLSSYGDTIWAQTMNITHNIFVAIIMYSTLAILVLFMLLEHDDLVRDFMKFFPEKNRETVKDIIIKITRGVGIYVGSKIILMILVGIMATCGLYVLDIKFALFLGLMAGILEIVPIIGPIIASIPAVIVALVQNPQSAVFVIILYIVIFKVVNNLLSPVIVGKCLNISPIVIIAALLIGGTVLGVSGVILSPAIVVVIYILTEELYLKKVNKSSPDEISTPDELK